MQKMKLSLLLAVLALSLMVLPGCEKGASEKCSYRREEADKPSATEPAPRAADSISFFAYDFLSFSLVAATGSLESIGGHNDRSNSISRKRPANRADLCQLHTKQD